MQVLELPLKGKRLVSIRERSHEKQAHHKNSQRAKPDILFLHKNLKLRNTGKPILLY